MRYKSYHVTLGEFIVTIALILIILYNNIKSTKGLEFHFYQVLKGWYYFFWSKKDDIIKKLLKLLKLYIIELLCG